MSRAAALGIGILSLAVTAALFVGVFALIKVSQVANDAAETSRVACQRTVVFGPFLATDFERRRVFPADLEPQYRSLIPKSCP